MTGALTLLVFVEVLVFVTGALTVLVGLAVFEIDGDTVVMMLVVGVCDFVKVAINSINFIKSAALNPAEAPSVETGETGVVEVGVVGVVEVGVVAGVVAGSVVGVVPSTAAPAVNFDVDLTLYFLKYLTFDAAFLATFFFTIFVATPPAGLISLNPETAAFDAGAIPSSDAVMPRATTFFTVFIWGRPFTLLSLINEWEPRFVTTNYN